MFPSVEEVSKRHRYSFSPEQLAVQQDFCPDFSPEQFRVPLLDRSNRRRLLRKFPDGREKANWPRPEMPVDHSEFLFFRKSVLRRKFLHTKSSGGNRNLANLPKRLEGPVIFPRKSGALVKQLS
jgi:hypothetical protein